MSSAGHVFDMIRRIRTNKANLTSNKAGFRDNIEIKEKRRKIFIQFKNVSDPELKSIKMNIRHKALIEKKRVLIIAIVVTMIFAFAYAWLLFL